MRKKTDRAWRRWVRNDAEYTLRSYDSQLKERSLPTSKTFQKHVEFLKQLDDYHETDDYIFVHAGVNPEKPLEETDLHDLVWIGDKFHNGYKGEKTVIFGHTRTSRLHEDPNNHDVYFGENNIIGIDGGAVYGGQLNCLDLTNNKMYKVMNRRKFIRT